MVVVNKKYTGVLNGDKHTDKLYQNNKIIFEHEYKHEAKQSTTTVVMA